LRSGDNRQRDANVCNKKNGFNHITSINALSGQAANLRLAGHYRSTYIVMTEASGCNVCEHTRLAEFVRQAQGPTTRGSGRQYCSLSGNSQRFLGFTRNDKVWTIRPGQAL
jgi:hypothetical protein